MATSKKTITAKVFLQSKSKSNPDDVQTQLVFGADYNDEANKVWAEYTPAIGLTMTVKDSVAKGLEQGDKFTLTFTPA